MDAEGLHIVCPHCDGVNRAPAARLSQDPKCGRCGKALFTGAPIALDAARFAKRLARSDLPVVVDFWAAWCGPCKAMAPIFERAARELEPRAQFVKIDVDANPGLASQYGVQGIPALFLFAHGKVVQRHAGLADLALLRKWVEAAPQSRAAV